MNKKFLSAILFGALMVTSTGTFVSCKDYDDDIDRIDTELSDLKSQLAALQTKVSEGKWITSLSSTTGGFTVAFNDGSSYTITNGKDGANGEKGETGAAGQDGKNGTTVEVKDGFWYLNGEKTEFVAVKKDDLGKALVPYVEGGYWVFYDKDGKAQTSDYKAWGNAWAVKSEGVWTLHMPDANGKDQAIELPTAAAALTSLSIGESKTLKLAAFEAWKLDRADNVIKKAADWKGTKTLPAAGDIVYTVTSDPIDLRINPVNVDGTEFEYKLVDAKNGVLSYVTLSAEEYKEYEPKGRAVYGNGLYSLVSDPFVVVKDAAEDFADEIEEVANRKYAVTTGGKRSEYAVTVASSEAPELSALNIKGFAENKATDLGTAGEYEGIKVGTKYTLTFDDEAALYDAYMVVADQYKSAFGITLDNAAKSFTVAKNPDVATIDAEFPMDVYTADNSGVTKKTTITISLSSVLSPAKDYELITKNVSESAKYFGINLATMKNNLGSNLNTWKLNVALAKTKYALYSKLENGTLSGEVADAMTGLFTPVLVSQVANDDKTATDVNTANFIKVKIDNTKAAAAGMKLNTTYYVKVTFNNASDSELNSIVVPVKFTAPAVSSFFAQKAGYVQDGVINAYFYKASSKKVDVKEYFSKTLKTASIVLGDKTVGKTDKKTSELVKRLADGTTFETASIELNDAVKKAAPNAQFELGYGEVLEFTATKDNYEGWKYTEKAEKEYAFKMKLMSSIIEGHIASATGNVISINANDATTGAEITAAMIKGYDYNGNAYNVVPDAVNGDAAAWANVFVKKVTPKVDTDNYMKSVTVKVASKDSKGVVTPGAFVVTANALSNTVTVDMPVTVEDIWGYTKTDKVKVEIKKN